VIDQQFLTSELGPARWARGRIVVLLEGGKIYFVKAVNALAVRIMIMLGVHPAVFLVVKSLVAPLALHQMDTVIFVVLGEESLSVCPKRTHLAPNEVVLGAVAFLKVLHYRCFRLEHVRAVRHFAEEGEVVANSVVVAQLDPVLKAHIAQVAGDPGVVLPPVVGDSLGLLKVFDRRLPHLTQKLHAHHRVATEHVRHILFHQT